jgi:hypothetical protein
MRKRSSFIVFFVSTRGYFYSLQLFMFMSSVCECIGKLGLNQIVIMIMITSN